MQALAHCVQLSTLEKRLYFLTLARAAARRAANVASAFLALSMAGRGFGIPVSLEAFAPAPVHRYFCTVNNMCNLHAAQ